MAKEKYMWGRQTNVHSLQYARRQGENARIVPTFAIPETKATEPDHKKYRTVWVGRELWRSSSPTPNPNPPISEGLLSKLVLETEYSAAKHPFGF